jgi:MFS family permease
MNRNVRLIYAHSIFTQMLFLLPVVVPYYHSIGLTFRDFLIGEAFFSVIVLVSEVPSGWVSDVWRRRTTLMCGALFGMIGLAGLMASDNFWEATISQGIIGIAVALNSGTNTALLYDSLYEEGRADDYRRIDGARHGFGIYGTAFSCIAGGLLFGIHPKLPLLADVFVLLIAMVVIFQVREPKRHQKSVEKHVFHDMWITMKYALTGHPEITGIIMLSTVILCTTKLMLWSQQPYYQMLGIPVEWFGIIAAGMYVIGGLGGQFGHKIDHWGSNRTALGFIALMLTVSCFGLIVFPSIIVALPLFLVGLLGYAMGQPRINSAINKHVGAERRATILSTANLMVHFLFIPTSAVVGWISEEGGIMASLLWMGCQLMFLSVIGLFLWKRSTDRVPA